MKPILPNCWRNQSKLIKRKIHVLKKDALFRSPKSRWMSIRIWEVEMLAMAGLPLVLCLWIRHNEVPMLNNNLDAWRRSRFLINKSKRLSKVERSVVCRRLMWRRIRLYSRGRRWAQTNWEPNLGWVQRELHLLTNIRHSLPEFLNFQC